MRRLTAIFALVVGAATLVLAIAVRDNQFPRGLVLFGCVLDRRCVRLVRRAAGGASRGWRG